MLDNQGNGVGEEYIRVVIRIFKLFRVRLNEQLNGANLSMYAPDESVCFEQSHDSQGRGQHTLWGLQKTKTYQLSAILLPSLRFLEKR
jgi:hypothetical protein